MATTRCGLAAGLLLAILPGLCAQEGESPKAPGTPGSGKTADEYRTELDQMYQSALNEWREAREKAAAKAEKDGGAIPAVRMQPDVGPVVDRALEIADYFEGTEDAVPFLVRTVQMGLGAKPDAAKAALKKLAADHVDSPGLSPLGPMMGWLRDQLGAEVEGAMDALRKSKNLDLRGWAILAQNKPVLEKESVGSDAYEAAKKAILAARAEAKDSYLRSEIQGAIDIREKFGNGMVAPDIVGVDLDGVAFKLSDYRGKIVFLDFWGDW